MKRLFPSTHPAQSTLYEQCRFGAFSSTGGDVVGDHRALEELLGAALPIFSWFKDWGSGWNSRLAQSIEDLRPERPYENLVCWEPWGVDFSAIAGGRFDNYIRRFFEGAAGYHGEVLMRPFSEMNGNWYPLSVSAKSPQVHSTQEWIEAWRRLVELARDVADDKIKFMFCANAADVGGIPVEEYWPGLTYVDYLGIDGYNWGWTTAGSPQQSPRQLFEPMYQRLARLHITAEFAISEVGCAEGSGKAGWYQDLYNCTDFPRVSRVVHFNERKERDWRLNSDPNSQKVNSLFLKKALVNHP